MRLRFVKTRKTSAQRKPRPPRPPRTLPRTALPVVERPPTLASWELPVGVVSEVPLIALVVDAVGRGSVIIAEERAKVELRGGSMILVVVAEAIAARFVDRVDALPKGVIVGNCTRVPLIKSGMVVVVALRAPMVDALGLEVDAFLDAETALDIGIRLDAAELALYTAEVVLVF